MMNRTSALLTAAVVLCGTAVCHAGDSVKGMVFAQQKTVTSQPEPTILPPPTTLPAEPQPMTLPPTRQVTPGPEAPMTGAPCTGAPCKKACCSWCGNCAAQCQRLIEWATYRPLTRCGPCGCLPCIAPCCSPPIYTFFLADCVEGGSCGCNAIAQPMPAPGCKTCATQAPVAAESKADPNKHLTGLLPMVKSCVQCGFSSSTATPPNSR